MLSLFRKNRPANASEDNIQPNETEVRETQIYEAVQRALSDIVDGKFQTYHCDDEKLNAILKPLVQTIEKQTFGTASNAVTLSMDMNEAVIAGAEQIKAAKDIAENMQTTASAAEELSASIANITQQTNEVGAEVATMNSITVENMRLTQTASDEIANVSNSVDEASNRLESLISASEEITDVVGFISDMAEQTNLLALNATIEAARAGEAGKGFAVVAHEVKQLANQTSENTQKIIQSVQNLQKEIEDVKQTIQAIEKTTKTSMESINHSNAGMHNILSASGQIDAKTQAIMETLDEQKSASDEIAKMVVEVLSLSQNNLEYAGKTLDAMDESEGILIKELQQYAGKEIQNINVLLAKSDHIIWKKRLANMIVGRESLNPSELADHHSCRLGKWYDAQNDENITSSNAYKALLDPHKKVHAHGIEAARLYNAKNITGAMSEIQKANEASIDVIRQIDLLLSEITSA